MCLKIRLKINLLKNKIIYNKISEFLYKNQLLFNLRVI